MFESQSSFEIPSSYFVFLAVVFWMTLVTGFEFCSKGSQVKKGKLPFSLRTLTILTRITLSVIQILGWGLAAILSCGFFWWRSEWLLSLHLHPETPTDVGDWAKVLGPVIGLSMMLFFSLVGGILGCQPRVFIRPISIFLKKKGS